MVYKRETIIKALECFHHRILNSKLAEQVTEQEMMTIIDALALIKELTEEKKAANEVINTTFGEIFNIFKRQYPKYAKNIEDYRPSRFMNGLTILLKDGFSLSVKYNATSNTFELLDLDNYTFYEESENDSV